MATTLASFLTICRIPAYASHEDLPTSEANLLIRDYSPATHSLTLLPSLCYKRRRNSIKINYKISKAILGTTDNSYRPVLHVYTRDDEPGWSHTTKNGALFNK